MEEKNAASGSGAGEKGDTMKHEKLKNFNWKRVDNAPNFQHLQIFNSVRKQEDNSTENGRLYSSVLIF
ncbi:hypothetical protein HHI36_001416, partial [Cryptolaemus montrouzieri]